MLNKHTTNGDWSLLEQEAAVEFQVDGIAYQNIIFYQHLPIVELEYQVFALSLLTQVTQQPQQSQSLQQAPPQQLQQPQVNISPGKLFFSLSEISNIFYVNVYIIVCKYLIVMN